MDSHFLMFALPFIVFTSLMILFAIHTLIKKYELEIPAIIFTFIMLAVVLMFNMLAAHQHNSIQELISEHHLPEVQDVIDQAIEKGELDEDYLRNLHTQPDSLPGAT